MRCAVVGDIEKPVGRVDGYGIGIHADSDRESRKRSKGAGIRVDAIANNVRARGDIQVGAGEIGGYVMAHRQGKWRAAERRQCRGSRVDTEARYAWICGV